MPSQNSSVQASSGISRVKNQARLNATAETTISYGPYFAAATVGRLVAGL